MAVQSLPHAAIQVPGTVGGKPARNCVLPIKQPALERRDEDLQTVTHLLETEGRSRSQHATDIFWTTLSPAFVLRHGDFSTGKRPHG